VPRETLYFGDLYERVTELASPTRTHRYYVHSPERVVAVVTRGGAQPGTLYLHGDLLGSVETLTDAGGTVVEKRSYDPFGQRRDPIWGQPAPASFSSRTTQGFTGHESDDELGLVNMKGRIYDPKIGRFLTTDPIVQAPLSGQSWNPYSYVLNNPLRYVDPSGFEGRPADPDWADNPDVQRELAKGDHWSDSGVRPPKRAEQKEGSREAVQVGAVTKPVDVGTTGNSSGYVPQPVTTAQADWIQNPQVQLAGGFLGGLLLGGVPFAGVGQQLLDVAEVLDHGTPEARLGLALGQIVGGVARTMGGLGGEVLGGIASVTGIGAVVGMPALAVSSVLVLGGVGNVAAGIRGLSQALMSQGSGSSGPQGTAPAARGGTYKLTDPKTGEVVRTGRTNDLARRQGEHARDPKTKGLDFEVDRRTDVYAEQRGREQMLHNQHKPPLNKVNPVSPRNPRRQDYLDAANNLE
jgi:RHS repeat-associated protein